MKRFVTTLFFAIAMLLSSVCYAAAGVVAYVNDDKDLIVVATNTGFTCAELYSGIMPYRGDRVYGTMTMYGMYPWVVNDIEGPEIMVYVDDFNCSDNDVFNWLRTK